MSQWDHRACTPPMTPLSFLVGLVELFSERLRAMNNPLWMRERLGVIATVNTQSEDLLRWDIHFCNGAYWYAATLDDAINAASAALAWASELTRRFNDRRCCCFDVTCTHFRLDESNAVAFDCSCCPCGYSMSCPTIGICLPDNYQELLREAGERGLNSRPALEQPDFKRLQRSSTE